MATVLQQQLAAIAEKSTNQLDLRAQRNQHSKSLLFEPKDAANQTFDTIYQICIDGFQDLCMIDSRFTPFGHNLFSEQSKGEDRTQMTSKENEELGKVIQNFLGLVSGRLLLRPGQKAIEWLVRRFRAHEYDTDWFIMAFLPYHANSIFPTMLSILPKQLSPALKFLQPYITALTSPPRQAVLYNAINNQAFFTMLNRFTLATAKQGHHTASVLGFWASIVAQAINGQLDSAQSGRADVRRQREEDLLLRVVPVLQEALRIPNATELYLGSCMIVTILVTKTQLEDKVLDSLMRAIINSWSNLTINDGLTCVSVICEERQSLQLPKASSKAILNIPKVSERLAELATRYQVGRLYAGLALHILDSRATTPQAVEINLLDKFFDVEQIKSSCKEIVIRTLLRSAYEGGRPLSDTGSTWTETILSRLASNSQSAALLEKAIGAENLRTEDVETKFQLTLPSSQQQGVLMPAEHEDVEMGEDQSPDQEELIEDALAAMPEPLSAKTTFLVGVGVNSSAYEVCERAFSLTCRQPTHSKKFLNHAAFSTTAEQVPLLTLLMRIWCSTRPVPVRLAAVREAKTILERLGSSSHDMQAILPYALYSLSDSHVAIRRSGTELISALAPNSEKSTPKSKTSSDLQIWGRDVVYGDASNDVKWMSDADMKKAISEAIIPALEECVMDPTQINRIVVSAIDASDEDRELKTSIRTALFNFLASHATITPVLSVKHQLLSILSHCGKVGSTGRAQILIPALKAWAQTSESEAFASGRNVGQQKSAVEDIDRRYLECVSARTNEELECLKVLASGESNVRKSITMLAFQRMRRTWLAMKPESQKQIGLFLLDAALQTGSDESEKTRQTEALDTLRQIDLPSESLITFLESVPDIASMAEKPPAAKRRRTSRGDSSRSQVVKPADLQATVRRLTMILELIESSKPERHPALLKGLFHALSELQHYKVQLGSDLVYLQQMTISSLLAIVDSLKNKPNTKVDRSVLRADLIVECVRSTSSTQVQNAALLLISSLASWAPDLVLHSVMPIFTFMSTTILRQSDDYSAHITDQTVSRVVPPLVNSLRKKNQDLVTGASELLLSFTAAFEHIPIDRRLRLFSHLVHALGPDEALPAVVAMLFEKYPTDRRVLPFAADLLDQFIPMTQLQAATQYLDLVADALQPKRTVSESVFGFNDKTNEQIGQSLRHLLLSLAKLVQNRKLHDQMARALKGGDAEATAIEQTMGALLERSLAFSKNVEARPHIHDAAGSVVAAALAVLPTPHFVRSVLPLLERPDDNLGLRILQSFEQRTETAKSSDQHSRLAMLAALPKISKVVESSTDATLKHSAVMCIDRIAEKYGKKDMEATLSAAQIVASKHALGSTDTALQVISLLCLSSMVDVLRDDMIGLVPQAVNQALDYLSLAIGDSSDSRLHNATYTFLSAVLEHLPWAFSAQHLTRSLRLSCEAAANPDLGRRSTEIRHQFANLAAKQLDVKALLSAIDDTYDTAVDAGFFGYRELLNILQGVVAAQTKPALHKNASSVFSTIQNAFDIRVALVAQGEAPAAEELILLDKKRDSIMLEAIMKLNDTVFRPHFVRLVESVSDMSYEDDGQDKVQRSISLFGFLATFFERLKTIVTGYSSYILDFSASVLIDTVVNGEVNKLLLKQVLETMASSFRHDQDDFWQAPSHFQPISEALLSLLVRAKSPAEREELAIIQTITDLAAAAGSQDHHKELNSALLKLMRTDDAQVRLAAVKCEQSLTENLGEDWLALLPEMLPFISELQEDDDETVERETLAWIRQIEGILGESLEGMLQ